MKSKQKQNDVMLQRIYQHAETLADLLKHSPEYIEFIEAKKKLEQDEANVIALRDLRKQQIEIHFAALSQEQEEEKNSFLNELYMAISLNPIISDYLNAEYKFNKVMQELGRIFQDIFMMQETTASQKTSFEMPMMYSDYLN